MINEAERAIRLARKHVHEGEMNSSVRMCLAEAIGATEREDWDAAKRWAVKSLSYSVGVGHRDYKDAARV